MTAPVSDPANSSRIRVKMLGKYRPGTDGAGWLKRFPGGEPRWGRCDFVFDRDCRDYDWLVVYDELPLETTGRHSRWVETLACPPEHTLLITVEPSSIKTYGRDYLRQFRWVLTTQPRWATSDHPGLIHAQPALMWFYADSVPRGEYDTIARHVPTTKSADFSTVCSSKRQGHTLHRRRYDFTQALKIALPELDIYGRGVRPLADKADALDPYRYHVTIENHVAPHHWTEKLADAFLGACLPVYHGCPNAEDYFPEESFLRIDLDDPELVAETLRRARRDRLWEARLPAILEARRRVLEDYGSFATVARLVTAHHDATRTRVPTELRSRRVLRRTPAGALRYVVERIHSRIRQRLED